MSSVIAYVDGPNLDYSIRATFGHRYLWLDLAALVERLRPDDTLERVQYCTTLVVKDPAALADQKTHLDALAARGDVRYEVSRFDAGHGSLVVEETLRHVATEIDFARRALG